MSGGVPCKAAGDCAAPGIPVVGAPRIQECTASVHHADAVNAALTCVSAGWGAQPVASVLLVYLAFKSVLLQYIMWSMLLSCVSRDCRPQLVAFVLSVYLAFILLFALAFYVQGPQHLAGYDSGSSLSDFEVAFWYSAINLVTTGFGNWVNPLPPFFPLHVCVSVMVQSWDACKRAYGIVCDPAIRLDCAACSRAVACICKCGRLTCLHSCVQGSAASGRPFAAWTCGSVCVGLHA